MGLGCLTFLQAALGMEARLTKLLKCFDLYVPLDWAIGGSFKALGISGIKS